MHYRSLTFAALITIFLCQLLSCQSGSPGQTAFLTDSASIHNGKVLFQQNCSSCHNFNQDGIGPNLSGVTVMNPPEWIRKFIQSPKSMIDRGDSTARKLLDQYHSVMPSFSHLSHEEIDQVIAYLHTQSQKLKKEEKVDPLALKDPIPEHIPASQIEVALEQVLQMPASSGQMPLTRLTKMDIPNGQNAPFLLDQRGILYHLVNGTSLVYLDMSKARPNFINQPGLATGFGSFAFHPEFNSNGLMYTTHTESPQSAKADFAYPDSIKVTLQWVLTEWKASNPTADSFSGTSRELLRINMVSQIHGVQEITFNPLAYKGSEDYGLLYMGVGDGGCVENGFPLIAHNKNSIWGTVVRIDPLGLNSRNGKYGVPRSNPFFHSKDSNTVKEIYAMGFRNPNRITWTQKKQMLVTNIGQAHIESVNLVEKGLDFGWPMREGSFAIHPEGNINHIYALPANDASFHFTYPIAEYDHDEGNAIESGFEVVTPSLPDLKGKYLFGDIVKGRLFYIDTKEIAPGRKASIKEWFISVNGKRTTLHELCKSDRVDMRFGIDKKGSVYIFTKADGKVYRIKDLHHS